MEKYYKACLKAGKRPQGMGYGDYSSMMKADGGEPMDEEDYDGMEEDEDGPGRVDKSETISAYSLAKALESYDSVEDALGSAGNSRESYLQARLDAGTITKSERAEIGKIWQGVDEDDGGTIRKSFAEVVAEEDEDAADLIEASDFLKSLIASVDNSLNSVSDEVTRDGYATRELLKAQGGLVRALVKDQIESRQLLKSQNEVIEVMRQRLGIVERTPAVKRSVGNHDPRSAPGRELAKSSVGGSARGSDQLSKSQVSHGMQSLMVKASEKGDSKAMDLITHASARFEFDGTLPKNFEQAIRQEIGAV